MGRLPAEISPLISTMCKRQGLVAKLKVSPEKRLAHLVVLFVSFLQRKDLPKDEHHIDIEPTMV